MYNVHNVKLNNVNNWINILELEKNPFQNMSLAIMCKWAYELVSVWNWTVIYWGSVVNFL